MKLAFYLARWLGSPYHNISAYKAGIAFTFLALAPFALIQEYSAKARRKLVSADPTLADSEWTPTRYAACSDRLGKEYMGIEVVDVAAAGGEHDWFDKGLAEESLRRCDRLADTFLRLVPAKR
jgi:3-keto steroid reductase